MYMKFCTNHIHTYTYAYPYFPTCCYVVLHKTAIIFSSTLYSLNLYTYIEYVRIA